MFVRVYDKQENKYYKSMVYGVIDQGYYEKAILFNPYEQCFELVEKVDKKPMHSSARYEYINSKNNDWITYEKTYLLKFKSSR